MDQIEPGRHLLASIEHFHAYGLGNCFQRSVAMVMDRPTARAVVGIMTSPEDQHEYIHCWVEEGDVDYDPTRFEDHEGIVALDREIFRASTQARDVTVVKRKIVMDMAREGKLSTWMLRQHVTKHQLAHTVGEELLTRIGYPFRVDPNEAILPLNPKPA